MVPSDLTLRQLALTHIGVGPTPTRSHSRAGRDGSHASEVGARGIATVRTDEKPAGGHIQTELIAARRRERVRGVSACARNAACTRSACTRRAASRRAFSSRAASAAATSCKRSGCASAAARSGARAACLESSDAGPTTRCTRSSSGRTARSRSERAVAALSDSAIRAAACDRSHGTAARTIGHGRRRLELHVVLGRAAHDRQAQHRDHPQLLQRRPQVHRCARYPEGSHTCKREPFSSVRSAPRAPASLARVIRARLRHGSARSPHCQPSARTPTWSRRRRWSCRAGYR